MSAPAITRSWILAEATPRPTRVFDAVLSVGLGSGFTVLLFLAVAFSERLKPQRPAPAIQDLAAVALPLEPPPPATEENAPEAPAPAGLDLALTPSTVKPNAADLLPEFALQPSGDTIPAPSARIELHLPSSLRPHTEMRSEVQHIFQRYEVDKVATVVSEVAPHVDRREMGSDVLRLNLIWVVEKDGSVSNVTIAQSSGNPKIDAIMVDTIKESIFAPALKGGRRVRMMTSQLITLRWSGGELFH